jgi:hypothetical protein
MLPTVVNLLKACEGHRPLIREAACTAEAVGEACSLLFRLALRCASSHFEGRFPWVDGRLPWVARGGVPTHGALVTGRSQGPGRPSSRVVL